MNHLTNAQQILSGTTFGESLSGTMHKIQCAEACILSALCDALEAANVPWDDYTSDYYDNSLELLGVGEWIPSAEQLDAIWALGFARLWTHPDAARHSPGEKYYERIPMIELKTEEPQKNKTIVEIRNGHELLTLILGNQTPRGSVADWVAAREWVTASRGAKAADGDILGRKCHECGAEWMTDMQLDVLADKVDPYIVKNRELTARVAELEAERAALVELETFVRERIGYWMHEYRVQVDPMLAKLDALRAQPSPVDVEVEQTSDEAEQELRAQGDDEPANAKGDVGYGFSGSCEACGADIHYTSTRPDEATGTEFVTYQRSETHFHITHVCNACHTKLVELCVCGHRRADHSPQRGLCRFNSCGGCESFKPAEVTKRAGAK